jgi:predicted molibdopterin-dependent oxidoreductase YjgC
MPDPRPGPVTFLFEGDPVTAPGGASIGAALWAAGIRRFRMTRVRGRPRALFCGIGQCFDCLVRVNGGPVVRACIAPVRHGDDVRWGNLSDDSA